jgi:hypothetical protein
MTREWHMPFVRSVQRQVEDVQKDDAQSPFDYDQYIDSVEDNPQLEAFELDLRKQEEPSSNGTLQYLVELQSHQTRNDMRPGTVFAVIDSSGRDELTYKCNVWLVTAAPLTDSYFFCVRIKTYKGKGIAQLKTHRDLLERMLVSASDPRHKRQLRAEIQASDNDIAAHTIVYRSGTVPIPTTTRAEPRMTKYPLGVFFADRISCDALDDMSRAAFKGPQPMRHGLDAVVLGRLDKLSMALLEIYVDRMGGSGVASCHK